MAYRNPLFGALHVLRIASAVTTTPAAASGFPAYRLMDSRGGELFKFTSSGANSRIDVDRGAGSLEAMDRLFIPAGHNLGTSNVAVYTSTTGAFGGEEVLQAAFACNVGIIDKSVTSNTHRYVRVVFLGTGQWEIGELWFTHRITTSARGPAYGWGDVPRPLFERTVFRSGVTATAILGQTRRVITLTYKKLPAADDVTLMGVLAAAGYGAETMLLWPMNDAEAPLAVEEDGQPSRAQDHQSPASTTGLTYTVGFSMVEALG